MSLVHLYSFCVGTGFLSWFLQSCSFADGMTSFIPRRVPVMEVMAFLVKRRMTAGQVRLCPSEGKEK